MEGRYAQGENRHKVDGTDTAGPPELVERKEDLWVRAE
jgi:hypothetical protein